MWFRQKQILVGCNLASYRFVFVFCQTGPRAQVAHGLKFAIICQIKQRGRAYGEQGRTWDENIASAHWVHREKRARRRTEKKKVMAGGDWIKQVTGHPEGGGGGEKQWEVCRWGQDQTDRANQHDARCLSEYIGALLISFSSFFAFITSPSNFWLNLHLFLWSRFSLFYKKLNVFSDHTGLNDQTSVLSVCFYFYWSLVLIFFKGESMQFFMIAAIVRSVEGTLSLCLCIAEDLSACNHGVGCRLRLSVTLCVATTQLYRGTRVHCSRGLLLPPSAPTCILQWRLRTVRGHYEIGFTIKNNHQL